MPGWAKTLLKIALALFILFILIRTGALEPVLILKAISTHPLLLLGAWGIYLLLSTLGGLRWYLLIKALGIHIPFKRAFSLHIIGLFFVTLLPGATGGDLVKGYYLYRDEASENKKKAIISLFMDRFIGVIGMLAIAAIMCLVNFDIAFQSAALRSNSIFYLAIFLGLTLVMVAFLSPLRKPLLNKVHQLNLPGQKVWNELAEALEQYGNKKGILILSIFLTMLVHFLLSITYFLCLLSLGLNLNFFKNAFVVPVISIINGLPIAPAGIGVTEAAGEVLYKMVGMATGGSETLALVHICVIATSLLGLPVYLLYKKKALNRGWF